MDFVKDKQTTTWNNQTTVNTHLTKLHTCNKGTQQPTKWLLVALKASVSGAHHQLGSKRAPIKAGQWITAHKGADSDW
jgi:hypothetical protein